MNVSEGWKLVPVEPTVEMKIAGDNAGWWCADKYRAMVAAAPDTPEQGSLPYRWDEFVRWVLREHYDHDPDEPIEFPEKHPMAGALKAALSQGSAP